MTVGNVPADQLRSIIERIERLREEKAAISEDEKMVFSEAKGAGFDVKTLRHILKLRQISTDERYEQEALLDTYLRALDMQPSFDFDEQTEAAA
jgi:uncharacterized protein (UPF0335 family)